VSTVADRRKAAGVLFIIDNDKPGYVVQHCWHVHLRAAASRLLVNVDHPTVEAVGANATRTQWALRRHCR
jgi:hypothetical protein